MAYTLSPTTIDGVVFYRLANIGGALARTTNEGRVFVTRDRSLADEALAYLNQPRVDPTAKMRGSHRMKSMFGAD